MGVLSPQFGGLSPSSEQQLLVSNYMSFTDGTRDFSQQYLPEIYEAEVERYGNRTLSGFLRMVGAEMPMMSDQVVWSEQNRLHIAYDNVSLAADGFTMTINKPGGGAIVATDAVNNAIMPNATIVVMDPNDPSFTVKAIVGNSGGAPVSPLAAYATFTAYAYNQKFMKQR